MAVNKGGRRRMPNPTRKRNPEDGMGQTLKANETADVAGIGMRHDYPALVIVST